jgi:hypothetical protein
LRGALVGSRVDHQRKALFGGGELRDVVLWMCAADVLLHRAILLLLRNVNCWKRGMTLTYSGALLPAARAIVIFERADDFIGRVGEVAGGRHGGGLERGIRLRRQSQIEMEDWRVRGEERGREYWDGRAARYRCGSERCGANKWVGWMWLDMDKAFGPKVGP